jgi:hypothetical protein
MNEISMAPAFTNITYKANSLHGFMASKANHLSAASDMQEVMPKQAPYNAMGASTALAIFASMASINCGHQGYVFEITDGWQRGSIGSVYNNYNSETGLLSGLASDYVLSQVKGVLAVASNEIFEPTLISNLNRSLQMVFVAHGRQAANALEKALKDGVYKEDIVVETIRSIGVINDTPSKADRFQILIGFLCDKSPIIRDAAALALSDMGDKGAISFLRAAAKRETFSSVKAEFLNVADELEEV